MMRKIISIMLRYSSSSIVVIFWFNLECCILIETKTHVFHEGWLYNLKKIVKLSIYTFWETLLLRNTFFDQKDVILDFVLHWKSCGHPLQQLVSLFRYCYNLFIVSKMCFLTKLLYPRGTKTKLVETQSRTERTRHAVDVIISEKKETCTCVRL